MAKAKKGTEPENKNAFKNLREAVKKISNRNKFKSPMERQRKVDKLKFDAAKTGGGAFTMDEMMPLKTLTSEGPGEVRNTPKGLKSGGRAGFKSGSVPVEKIKKEFPDASPQKIARLQTMLGDKTTPMKKERLFEGDRGRRKNVLKKAAKTAVKALTPFKSGGRIGLKAGSKGCKLAMKGKGKAYGKNS